MEPNNFTIIFHCKTNKITQALIYAVLEWILIFFLLLNSLLSYLILKFSIYFGLKPPCPLCSRVDHIFDSHNSNSSYRNLICQQHSIELSKSGYCFNHRKLVESHDMCENCSSRYPDLSSVVTPLICSCCGVTVKSKETPTHVVIESSFGVSRDTHEGNSVTRDGYLLDFDLDGSCQGIQKGNSDQGSNAAIKGAYENDIIIPHHLEFYIDNDDYGLIPVNLLNLDQEKSSQLWRETDDELVFEPDFALSLPGIDGEQNLNFSCLDFMKFDEQKVEEALPNTQVQEKVKLEADDDDIMVRLDENKVEDLEKEFKGEVNGTMKLDETSISLLLSKQGQVDEEVDADVEKELIEVDVKILSIDSEIVCHKESEEGVVENGKIQVIESSTSYKEENPSGKAADFSYEKEKEVNEVEEDNIDSLQLLHRKIVFLGRSKSENEESLDESDVSDIEEVTIDELKSELRSERKALRVLYDELEEERNAAAVAASHTMAMINRLQQEKAAIEMEALQYQRIMEEQAEYDQEALQVMNEILVKRERELEMYRMNDTHTDAIMNMKSALSCFDEERISILEQLKVLDGNLCTLAEEEERQIRNMNPFEEFNEENDKECLKHNGSSNGCVELNGDHHKEKAREGSNDEWSDEDEVEIEDEDEDEGRLDPYLLDGIHLSRFNSEKRRFTIEEEVERLYERLEALEADKEFIKHCIGSLRKGDRGIDLLQEILQHLRDLRSVEFRRRSIDGVC